MTELQVGAELAKLDRLYEEARSTTLLLDLPHKHPALVGSLVKLYPVLRADLDEAMALAMAFRHGDVSPAGVERWEALLAKHGKENP